MKKKKENLQAPEAESKAMLDKEIEGFFERLRKNPLHSYIFSEDDEDVRLFNLTLDEGEKYGL